MSKPIDRDGDVSFIKALAELLRANDLTEVQVKRDYAENDSLNVRVSRHLQMATQPQGGSMPMALPAPVTAATMPTDDPAGLPGAVTSPMVGTVYLQGEPGTPPFVSVGATVKEGDTLIIIEAMKTMNQIPAPRAGIVRRILVADGNPVEYGAPLMIIE